MDRLVECVPNFSEGRERSVIDAIAQALASVSGVKLLDVDPGADTNRTVYTLVGPPDEVGEAAFRGARRATELIDMTAQKGAHPRMGALDVCPFIPVSGITMAECADLARAVGRRIGDELQIPVFFYEHAAASEERRSLANIRAGEYEGLAAKLEDPAWAPDAGPARFNPRSGGTVVGAREFLLAYNVNLNTLDRRLANEIALNIREGGRAKRDAKGEILRDASGASIKIPGRLKAVRAIGWYIEQYRQAQVSINLLDYTTTPLHVVFETARDEAGKLGLIVTGSELVGLTPLAPMLEAGRYFLRKQGKSAGVPERELVEIAVRSMGLDSGRGVRAGEEDHRVPLHTGGAADVDARDAVRRRGVDRVAGAGRRVRRRADGQPRGGARDDGGEPHRREEGLRRCVAGPGGPGRARARPSRRRSRGPSTKTPTRSTA